MLADIRFKKAKQRNRPPVVLTEADDRSEDEHRLTPMLGPNSRGGVEASRTLNMLRVWKRNRE